MSLRDRFRRRTGADAEPPADPHAAYVAALTAQREEKDAMFRIDPYSPLPHEARERFEALSYYEPDPAYQFALTLDREPAAPLTFETSTGDQRPFERIGTVRFEVAGEEGTLAIYQDEEGGLFLPFRDGTSGGETYGAGRYLEPIGLGGDRLLVDFNLAYNPYCAYAPDYSCPLPPIENWLKLPIRAGERYPHRTVGEGDGGDAGDAGDNG